MLQTPLLWQIQPNQAAKPINIKNSPLSPQWTTAWRALWQRFLLNPRTIVIKIHPRGAECWTRRPQWHSWACSIARSKGISSEIWSTHLKIRNCEMVKSSKPTRHPKSEKRWESAVDHLRSDTVRRIAIFIAMPHIVQRIPRWWSSNRASKASPMTTQFNVYHMVSKFRRCFMMKKWKMSRKNSRIHHNLMIKRKLNSNSLSTW